MTKKDIRTYLWDEQERIMEEKAVLISQLFELDNQLKAISKQMSRQVVVEDTTPEGRMRTRKLADEVSEELRGPGGGGSGISF